MSACPEQHCNALAACSCRSYLLCTHREHVQIDAVEFIKATPQTTLCKAFVNLPHALVIHLIAAVENNNIPAGVRTYMCMCVGVCWLAPAEHHIAIPTRAFDQEV